MSATLDLTGLDKRLQQIRTLTNLNAVPLMITWGNIIAEDNRRGILLGLDKNGVPMRPVTYRPKPPGPLKPTKAQRGGKRSNVKAGPLHGGIHNNLSSMEYRLLGGPPLAPRNQFSRVITNLVTTFTDPRQGAPHWSAVGAWQDVVSTKNVHFLPFHFLGLGRLPRRDLRGVRPAGMQKARQALQNWARLEIRKHFS